MTRTFTFMLASCLFLKSHSQDYFINPDNDTVKGTVLNYKEWSKSPLRIDFRVATSGIVVHLTPFNCQRVVIGASDHYISYHGTRVSNVESLSGAVAPPGNETMKKDSVHVFLRRVYHRGQFSLYKLFDDKRNNFFLEKDKIIRELEFFEYLNETNVILPFDGYKAVLREELWPENKTGYERHINALRYKEDDLVKFMRSVLGDSGDSQPGRKYPSVIYAGGGISFNGGKISNSAASDSKIWDNSFTPFFEFGIRIYNQRNMGRIFFQPSINVNSSVSHRFQLKDGSEYRAKAMFATGQLGFGYYFRKNPAFSVYGLIAGGMRLVINYETEYLNGTFSSNDAADKVLNKVTIHPELGCVINGSFNIVLSGTLPMRLPLYTNSNYVYSTTQAGVALRYIFSRVKK